MINIKQTFDLRLESSHVLSANTMINPTSLRDVMELSKNEKMAIFSVDGNCMEGANIPDKGYVAINFKRFPRPKEKDACLCCNISRTGLKPGLYIKRYCGKFGDYHCVSTCYQSTPEKATINGGFFVQHILGVVFAAWDEQGNLLWEKDVSK